MAERVKQYNDSCQDDVAYTIDERRSNFLWKTAISATSAGDLIEKLNGEIMFSKKSKQAIIRFVFAGEGVQWCGMGRELLASCPVFRSAMERIEAKLTSIGAPFDSIGGFPNSSTANFSAVILLIFPLVDEIMRDPKGSQIGFALCSQPIYAAVQIALVDLLRS